MITAGGHMQMEEKINEKIEAISKLVKDYKRSSYDEDSDNLRHDIRKLGKDIIKELDLNRVIRDHRDMIARRMSEKIDEYLLTSKKKSFADAESPYTYSAKGHRYREYYTPVNADNFTRFVDTFLDGQGYLSEYRAGRIVFGNKRPEEFILNMINSDLDPLTGRVVHFFRTLKAAADVDLMPDLRRSFKDRSLPYSILNDARKGYNRRHIQSLLVRNPLYGPIYEAYIENYRQQERIRTGLLDAIPDTYPELFPLARSMMRHFILHIGPTNSGKSYMAIEALKEAESGVYLAPLRLLAYEKYEELNEAGCFCSLKTGEEEIRIPGAALRSSTIEILDYVQEYDVAVIDEAQLVADPQRGSAWTMAILGVRAKTVHVCLAPEAENVVTDIINACGDTYEITRHERLVPLVFERSKDPVFPRRAKRGDAFIVFSRKDVHAAAAQLQAKGYRCSVIYGNLPYDVRRNEVKRYVSGQTDVVVATDAIGMGMNLPISRVIFLKTIKFDGTEERELLPSEVKQIAGRAGRFGMFDKGYVMSDTDQDHIRAALDTAVPQIKEARIGFPYTLIGIEGSVSQLMQKWMEIKPKPGFQVADMTREIELAGELEKISDDKDLIYKFVMFPYDEKNEVLKSIWYQLFLDEMQDRPRTFMQYLPAEPSRLQELYTLEGDFKICDLLYHYADTFAGQASGAAEEISHRKNQISRVIMKKLSQEKLERRTCRHCGKVLPFGYKSNICKNCQNSRRKKWK